jgi:peptide/nickel transport system ATP-binding protein
MDLIEDLQKQVRTSAILITHNLGLLAQFASRVIVMYLGRVLEAGTIYDIFDSPKHPYTQGLLNAVPKIGRRSKYGKSRLTEIEGNVPNPIMAPPGCKFHPRCKHQKKICQQEEPLLQKIDEHHHVRCWV